LTERDFDAAQMASHRVGGSNSILSTYRVEDCPMLLRRSLVSVRYFSQCERLHLHCLAQIFNQANH
jgi:hypothetical protein